MKTAGMFACILLCISSAGFALAPSETPLTKEALAAIFGPAGGDGSPHEYVRFASEAPAANVITIAACSACAPSTYDPYACCICLGGTQDECSYCDACVNTINCFACCRCNGGSVRQCILECPGP